MAIKNVEFGSNVTIHHPDLVNLFDCKIGSDCVIASFVEIGRGVVIGDRVKIQAFAYIPEGVTIEDEVFISPNVCFTNDKFPRSTNPDVSLKGGKDWEVRKTLVCKRAAIGANSTIVCGVTIGEGALVGAGSVVTKDVPPRTIVAGNAARVIKKLDEIE